MATALVFRYHMPCKVDSLAPTLGPEAGGQVVRILGHDFVKGGTAAAYVYFGAVAVPCATIDVHTVECITPQHAAKSIALQLSFNAGPDGDSLRHDTCDTIGDALLYRFARTIAASLTPASGPTAGGTLITIEGSNFGHASALTCILGLRTFQAQYLSPSSVQCQLPPGVIGTHRLIVSSNGQLVGSMNYEYQAVARVSALNPVMGLVTGGTMVTVMGAHFSRRSAAIIYTRCNFNMTAVPAIFVRHSMLECPSPPHATSGQTEDLTLSAGRIPVEVSNNAMEYSTDRVVFEYTDHLQVMSRAMQE